MVEIALLADHPETIPTLAEWFRAQWPNYNAQRTTADIEREFHSEANRDGLPLRLLAFEDDRVVGTIVLRERALRTLPEYRPGLGGLFVVELRRGRGVGTELVRAGMNTAGEQGYQVVYAATAVAGAMLERLGWQLVKTVAHGNEQLALYSFELDRHGPSLHGAVGG